MDHAAKATQFIGRAVELARLDAAAARAADGNGGVVIVGGEAGIGKTRLLEQFSATVRDRGARVLAGACLEFGGQGLPFAPFVEALRTLVTSVDPARLPDLLGPGRHALARLLPSHVDRPVEVADGLEFDQRAQARLFESVLAVIERLGRSTPVVLILEDFQWADEDTRDLLIFLARNLRTSRALVVLSLRTDEVDREEALIRLLGELERDTGVERIELRSFSRAELGEMLTIDSGRAPSAELLDGILGRSGGNPFYAEQLLGMTPASGMELPRQLHDVLLARLADLSPATQDVVRSSAAAGLHFDDDLLAGALGMPAPEIEDALREAIEAGILREEQAPGEPASYTFRHTLLREFAYGLLVAGEQVRLHAGFARRLQERQASGTAGVSAAELAYHLDAARDYAQAVPALAEAGAEAEHAFAFGLGRRFYERALAVWDRSGLDGETLVADHISLSQHAAECALLMGAYDRAIELGRAAVRDLERTDRPDPARLGALHDRLRWYLWEAGQDEAAGAAVAEALRLIPAEPPSRARARALGQAAGLRMYAGNLREASELALQAIDTAVDASAAAEEALARGVLGWCQAMSGEVDRGIATFRDGVAIAEGLGGVEGIALGHGNLAALLDRVGRTESSLEAAMDGFAIVRRLGVSRTYGGMLLGQAAKALFDLGRWSEAEAVAVEGLGLDPVGRWAVWLHVNQARLDTNLGRYSEAVIHLERARDEEGTAGRSGGYEVSLLAARADLARWQGRLEDVRAAVEAGIGSVTRDRPLDPALGWLAATGLRAEADAAVDARARHDTAAVARAEERGSRIIGLAKRLSRVPATAADGRREAILALCRAEAGRLRGTSEPSAWELVARRWDALQRPYPAAYARFRVGEAVLAARGSRENAAEALRLAERTVVALGATPLRGEIELLAQHARISLVDDNTAAARPAARPAPGLGLTQRESEVLGLVAAGWSNQQIADALFITRKTASVHVSNILGKFGVRNRVEAAAIAHRLGVTSDRGAAPDA
ncbi:MAG: hypothetical protein QOJ75_1094 [Chloroflexota bacterium]|nr:hypothetical protein [Chloroflexota bacterium]